MLGVLDAEAAVARTVRPGDAVVDRQEDPVGAIADGVHGDLEPGGVRITDPAPHVRLGVLQQSAISRRVAVGLEEVRGPRARRPVHEALHPADLHPGVAGAPGASHGIGHGPPRVERQVEGHAQREPARALEPAVAGEVRPRGGHVRGGGDPQAGGVGQCAGQRRVAALGRRLGDRPPDDVERSVLENAGRLPGPRVAQDLPARGRGSLLGDVRRAHRGRVRERFVPVQAIHEDGVVRRHRIDPLVLREPLARPAGVIPVAAQDPLPRLERLGVCLDAADEFRGSRRVAQVDRRELEATVNEVGVAVGEAGHDEPAPGAHDGRMGPHVPRHRGGFSHGGDLPPRDRDRARSRGAVRQSGPEHPAGDHQVGLAAAGGEGQTQHSRGQAPNHRCVLSGVW